MNNLKDIKVNYVNVYLITNCCNESIIFKFQSFKIMWYIVQNNAIARDKTAFSYTAFLRANVELCNI